MKTKRNNALFVLISLVFILFFMAGKGGDKGFLLLLAIGPIFDFLAGFGMHLFFTSVFPAFHKRHQTVFKSAKLASSFLGGAIFLLIVAFAVIFGGPIAAILFVLLLILLGLGLQAPAASLGARIFRDKTETSRFSEALWGWFAFSFVQYTIAGFFVTLGAAIMGIGAFMLSFTSTGAILCDGTLDKAEGIAEDAPKKTGKSDRNQNKTVKDDDN